MHSLSSDLDELVLDCARSKLHSTSPNRCDCLLVVRQVENSLVVVELGEVDKR